DVVPDVYAGPPIPWFFCVPGSVICGRKSCAKKISCCQRVSTSSENSRLRQSKFEILSGFETEPLPLNEWLSTQMRAEQSLRRQQVMIPICLAEKHVVAKGA